MLSIVNHIFVTCAMHNVSCKEASGLIFTILSLASDNNCTDGDIRLVRGSISFEKIVEMC